MSQKSKQEFRTQDILGKHLTRTAPAQLRRGMVDGESRTVEMSFSSENPIYHWFGYLILDHSEGSARLDRIKETGALLVNHDRNQQCGGIEEAGIGDDRKGRATVKFSQSQFGTDIMNDVNDGIRRGVSFGFCLYGLDPEVGKDGKQLMLDGEPVYRSKDWEPFELTVESIPADTSVGMNRSLEENLEPKILDQKDAPELARDNSATTENTMPEENNNPANPAATETREQTAAPAAPVVQNAAITRAAEFNAYGAQFGEVELARDMALDETKTLTDLGKAILEKRSANQPKIPAANPQTVAERNGGSNIELARSIPRGTLKAFRGAKAFEYAYRAAQFVLAALFRDDNAMKFCRENGIQYTRAANAHGGGNNSDGGFFVPVEMESAIIDLRVEYGVVRRRFDITTMTSDTKLINRRVGGLKAVPVGPGKRGTLSKAAWDQIELIARKWMVLAKIEDELSEDASISMVDTLVSEIAYAFTQSEDAAGFLGDGSSQFHGIVGLINKLRNPMNASSAPAPANVAGLQVASSNQWSEIIEADLLGVVGRLPQFARRSGQVAWFCSHTFWANVLQRIALAKGGVTMAEINGELKEVFMGKPVEIVEVMPTVEGNSQIPLLYGNATQAATLGDRRGVTIKMTDSNDVDFESDIQSVKGTERFDINVHDVGNADANPAKQQAGPIVGLITASS